MVNPVGNPYTQSIPAATTFQPGETRRTGQDPRLPDITKPSGTETARTEASSTRVNNQVAYNGDTRSKDTGGVTASGSRGTQLDLTV